MIQKLTFMKSGGFHPWNPADFMKSVKSGRFHPWNPADFTREIRWISWNLADSTLKSGRFHEIWWISWNPWNPADFTQISPVKSTQNYKSKCFSKNSSVWWMQGGGFHPWNPPDFTLKSGRFHLWNPPKIIKASVLAKTLQFDECREGAMTKDFMKFTLKSGGFHPEIWQISPRFHLWNPPKW